MKKAMTPCKQFRMLLVKKGQASIGKYPLLQVHVEGCNDCQALLRAWRQVPELLDQLPEHDRETDRTTDRRWLEPVMSPVTRPTAEPGIRQRRGRWLMAPSLASAVVLLAAVGISREMITRESPDVRIAANGSPHIVDVIDGDDKNISTARLNDSEPEAAKQVTANEFRSRLAESKMNHERMDERSVREEDALLPREKKSDRPVVSSRLAAGQDRIVQAETASGKAAYKPEKELSGHEYSQRQVSDESLPEGGFDRARPVDTEEFAPSSNGRRVSADQAAFADQDLGLAMGPGSGPGLGSGSGQGLDFLTHYQKTTDLTFQPASGYWANTYIPGDPEIRLLSARLAQIDRSWLKSSSDLEQTVKPVLQPFDAPTDSALALSLMTDATGVAINGDSDEPTRLRLQVGIQGIEHRRGHRPAMNVAIVIDLPRDVEDHVRIAARTLLDAMLQSKQAGDQFSLVMTADSGAKSGLVVKHGDFRYGALHVAREIILGQSIEWTGNSPDSAISSQFSPELSGLKLNEALLLAGKLVSQSDDHARPLGSKSVLLVSANELRNVENLTALVHEHAKSGITLSAVPLGNRSDNGDIESLVLAGLGNRRYLENPAQAEQLIEEELHAASRAVARAVRLSIRLAPDVQLIGVVGSERLDTHRSQQVREIETSMDRRLSHNLGIQSDRGDDEQGIQIVIPGIYSGDSVTVLIDVVTSRPGAVADVTLRYKDLIFLRNGSLQGHLSLPGHRAGRERGRAELAVFKNLLSHHFTDATVQAASAIAGQQAGVAVNILRTMHETIGQARQTVTGWANDPDLLHDQKVLSRFIEAMLSPESGAHQLFLADALRYASWAKAHEPLEDWK